MRMKSFLLLMALVCISLNLGAQCLDSANVYSFTYGGRNYEVVKELRSWSYAAACAVERGGHLVEINDLDEQNAVYSAITTGAGIPANYTAVPNGGGIAYIWIGATDQLTEGIWLWDGNNDNSGLHFWSGQGANGAGNGTPIAGSYHNWGGKSTGTVKEPDNYGSNQSHAAMALAGWPSGTTLLGITGEWNDIIGTSSIYYVIEYDAPIGFRPGHSLPYNIYPNPTQGIIHIEGNFLSIALLDQMGRCIDVQENVMNPSIDISPYPGGVFFLRMQGSDYFGSEKIIHYK